MRVAGDMQPDRSWRSQAENKDPRGPQTGLNSKASDADPWQPRHAPVPGSRTGHSRLCLRAAKNRHCDCAANIPGYPSGLNSTGRFGIYAKCLRSDPPCFVIRLRSGRANKPASNRAPLAGNGTGMRPLSVPPSGLLGCSGATLNNVPAFLKSSVYFPSIVPSSNSNVKVFIWPLRHFIYSEIDGEAIVPAPSLSNFK